ncbi:hypothetical protein [Aeromicrobium sp. Leaf350]|uniref:hypothetical protein n=1 Tax=Aeromicrobium sp. Leaf350 TaxID=2876565 RepID=UPI001E4C1C10|nr:hypothetical protein [Aeromicrobium sp. Leaf350]
MSLRLLAVASLLGLALAACGGGSTDGEPEGGSSGDDWGFDSAADDGSEDGSDGPGTDGSTAEQPTGTPADPANYTDSYSGHAFATPTGNIICYVNVAADQWGCVIGERTYTEPAGAEDCFASFGKGFVSVQGGPLQPQCRGGVLAEAENGAGAILPYGSTLTVGSVTCLSEQTGVTCVDQRSGHSLFISKAKYEIS